MVVRWELIHGDVDVLLVLGVLVWLLGGLNVWFCVLRFLNFCVWMGWFWPDDLLFDVLDDLDEVISVVGDVLDVTHFEVIWVEVQELRERVVLAFVAFGLLCGSVIVVPISWSMTAVGC